ncbi:MAG: hypothetical protein PHY42_03535 [Bacilli bacterium]|nr:hypothetical protein [Bacilli bacterium]
MLNTILLVLYLAILAFVCAMVIWIMFTSKKLTDKIIGAIAIILFLLRLLLVK